QAAALKGSTEVTSYETAESHRFDRPGRRANYNRSGNRQLPALQPGIGMTGSGNCVRVNIFEMGESIWPLPIIPIAVWSLAPALSLFGVLRILGRKRGFAVVLVALLVEATAIISFVAAPMFLLYVFVPLAVTTLLASIAAAPRLRRPATGSRIEPLSSSAVAVAEKTEKPA